MFLNLCYGDGFGQDFESCKQRFLGKFQLKTAQTVINYDLKDRLPQMGPVFLNFLSNFPFKTHLQIYARPGDLARVLNLENEVF